MINMYSKLKQILKQGNSEITYDKYVLKIKANYQRGNSEIYYDKYVLKIKDI